MKSESWRPTRRGEMNFEGDIFKMLLELLKTAPSNLGEFTARILMSHEFLDRYSWQAAQRMVTGRLLDNTRTWRQASRESMRGELLHQLLTHELSGSVGARVRQLIHTNSQLIRTLPSRVAALASQHIATVAQGGDRAETNIPALLRHVSHVEARRIARTETSKMSTALTRVRAENLGADWYVWRTSEDARVRFAHRKMATVLVRWQEPPAPERLVGEHSTAGSYNAGDIWNCRCYPEPLLRLTQVGWPHRVFYGGRVVVMRLADFRRIANVPQPLAA